MTDTATKKTKNVSFFAAALCLCLFFLFRESVLTGMKNGLSLCAETLFPALFPFLVLSGFIRENGLLADHSRLSEWVENHSRISCGGIGCFVIGHVCGFPIGAKEICDAFTEGRIEKREAERLLPTANAASPAFVIAGIGAGMLGSAEKGLWIWGICVLTDVVACLLFSTKRECNTSPLPRQRPPKNIAETISESAYTMIGICGTICFFSVISSLFSQILPPIVADTVLPFVELTTGVKRLSLSGISPRTVTALTAGCVSFGGISVYLQARLFIAGTDLDSGFYFPVKCVSAILSFLLAFLAGGLGVFA